MIETREIDPQDHRALFRQIVEDRRAGRISADYPAWFHLMAKLLQREIRGDESESALIFGRNRVSVIVALCSRRHGWSVRIKAKAPKNLIDPPKAPRLTFAMSASIQDAFDRDQKAFLDAMRFQHEEPEAWAKWVEVEQICRGIYGGCETAGEWTVSANPECVEMESLIYWRRGRG